MREYREIMSADVGKPIFHAFGRPWKVNSFIGRVLPGDIGKRVYLHAAGFLQVENDGQRAARLEGVRQVSEEQFDEIVAMLNHAKMMDEAARADHLTLNQKLILQRFAKEARERAHDLRAAS